MDVSIKDALWKDGTNYRCTACVKVLLYYSSLRKMFLKSGVLWDLSQGGRQDDALLSSPAAIQEGIYF